MRSTSPSQECLLVCRLTRRAALLCTEYSWLTTCVYLAILVFEFPQNYLIQRLPVAKWFSFNIFAWGVTVTASAAANNFTGLVIVSSLLFSRDIPSLTFPRGFSQLRTLLGVFECSIQRSSLLQL